MSHFFVAFGSCGWGASVVFIFGLFLIYDAKLRRYFRGIVSKIMVLIHLSENLFPRIDLQQLNFPNALLASACVSKVARD